MQLFFRDWKDTVQTSYKDILIKKLIGSTASVIMSLILNTFAKAISCLVIFFAMSIIAHADEWDFALRRAKKEDKPTILYFFTPYCFYCQTMDKEVLANKEVFAILNKNVVYLRIDVEKREDLARFYGVRGYPTTVFLQPNGQQIIQIPGYINRKDFKKLLTFVTGKHYKTMKLREFLQKTACLEPLKNRPEPQQIFHPIWKG